MGSNLGGQMISCPALGRWGQQRGIARGQGTVCPHEGGAQRQKNAVGHIWQLGESGQSWTVPCTLACSLLLSLSTVHTHRKETGPGKKLLPVSVSFPSQAPVCPVCLPGVEHWWERAQSRGHLGFPESMQQLPSLNPCSCCSLWGAVVVVLQQAWAYLQWKCHQGAIRQGVELLRPNSERMHTGLRAGTWKAHDPEPGENYPRLPVLVRGRHAMGHTGWS